MENDIKRAEQLYQDQRYEEALAVYEEAIRQSTSPDPRLYSGRAATLKRLAEQAHNTALELGYAKDQQMSVAIEPDPQLYTNVRSEKRSSSEPRDGVTQGADDNQLVQRAMQGDRYAFSLLFYRYNSFICGAILHIVRNQQDMEDIAGLTWVKVWSNLPTLREGSNFKAWLTRVARNIAYDHLRATRPKVISPQWDQEGENHREDEKLIDPQNLEDRVATAIAFEEARETALKIMRSEQKMAFILHLQGWKLEAIGKRLDLTEGTVKTYINGAYRILREEFHKKLDGDQNNGRT